MLKEEAMTPCIAKKFACYLRNTCAVSALEYAIVVGVSAVVVSAAYETFKGNIKAAITALARSLIGG